MLMGRKTVLIILVILGISSISVLGFYIRPAKGIIWIEGHITSDTTWSSVDTYRVIDNTYVDTSVTLTVLPGVNIQFADGFSLIVDGSLNATGTEVDPIIFTSSRVAKDPPDPYPGAWSTIKFNGNLDEIFLLKHVNVEYAVDGITIESIGPSMVTKSDIHNCSKNGVKIIGESSSVIIDNIIKLNDQGIRGEESSKVHIFENHILANKDKGIYFSGTDIYDIFIAHNVIKENGERGIHLNGAGSIYHVSVYNNTVYNNQGGGIDMTNFAHYGVLAHDVKVFDNTVTNNQGIGIKTLCKSWVYGGTTSYIWWLWVANNNVIDNTGSGISVECDADRNGYIYELSLLNNTIINNIGNGINVYCSYHANMRNVTLSGNVLVINSGSGISLSGGSWSITNFSNVSVSYNTVGSNNINGIFLKGCGESSLVDNIVSANEKGICIEGNINTNISRNSVSYNEEGVMFYSNHNDAHWNDICDNTHGMSVATGSNVNAEYNFWGHSTGPYHESLNFEGQGNPVNGDGTDLDFIPYLTSPVGTINDRPVARLGVDKLNPIFNETVTFSALDSSDDGRIDYYFFDFGDGIDSGWTTLPVVTHKYAEKGTYNATLVVMDDFGVTSLNGDLVCVTITVVPEFPSLIALPLLMIATLLGALAYRRKRFI